MEAGPCVVCECREFLKNPFKPRYCRNCQHDHAPPAPAGGGGNSSPRVPSTASGGSPVPTHSHGTHPPLPRPPGQPPTPSRSPRMAPGGGDRSNNAGISPHNVVVGNGPGGSGGLTGSGILSAHSRPVPPGPKMGSPPKSPSTLGSGSLPTRPLRPPSSSSPSSSGAAEVPTMQVLNTHDTPAIRMATAAPRPDMSRRDHIAHEILESERYYVRNLGVIVDTFLRPLLEGKRKVDESDHESAPPPEADAAATGGKNTNNKLQSMRMMPRRKDSTSRSEGVITEGEINVIFSNIVEILNLNQILLQDLEERMKTWNDKTTLIGDVLCKFVPYLKSYIVYARMNEKAQELLMTVETKPAYCEFVKSWEKLSDVQQGGGLRAYLILPIQRIPRYELFIKDLVKSTDPSHPDYNNLSKAYDEVKEVNHKINESIREAENRLKLLEISRSFMDNPVWGPTVPTLVEPHRVFVKEGALTKICRSKHVLRWVVLFNDILLYASDFSIGLTRKLQFHKMFHLESLRVDDVPDKETAHKSLKNAFQIVSPNKSFVLYAASPELKEEWVSTLRNAIKAWQTKRATLATSKNDAAYAITEAPVWIPDDEVASCMLCASGFTLTKRRHHCRSCGKVICGDCSRKKLLLLNVDKSPVRVCDYCYNSLAGPREEKKDAEGASRPAATTTATTTTPDQKTSPRGQVEYLALYDFKAESERELSLKVGERLWVVEEEMDGWFEAKAFDGRIGFVPSTYVRKV